MHLLPASDSTPRSSLELPAGGASFQSGAREVWLKAKQTGRVLRALLCRTLVAVRQTGGELTPRVACRHGGAAMVGALHAHNRVASAVCKLFKEMGRHALTGHSREVR